jgi:hypothetical protein
MVIRKYFAVLDGTISRLSKAEASRSRRVKVLQPPYSLLEHRLAEDCEVRPSLQDRARAQIDRACHACARRDDLQVSILNACDSRFGARHNLVSNG